MDTRTSTVVNLVFNSTNAYLHFSVWSSQTTFFVKSILGVTRLNYFLQTYDDILLSPRNYKFEIDFRLFLIHYVL